jgi:CubicO group peptidase (beta-lactamase class C family)
MAKTKLLPSGSSFFIVACLCCLTDYVAADQPRVWPVPDWVTATPDSQGVLPDKLEALRAFCEERKSRVLLVIRHGRIVGEWYWDNTEKETVLPVYSVTKSIASTAAGFLVDDGKMKLDQPAADFFPEWRNDDRKAITVRHLLSMTSGLKNEELGYFLKRNQLQQTLEQTLTDPPGTKWNYNNLACNALSGVVRKASGEELSAFLLRRLFEPLGIKNVKMDRSGDDATAYAGLRMSARDLAKIGYLFLNKGLWNGKRLLSETWVRQATKASQDLNEGYGLLWWVCPPGASRAPKDAFFASGLFGNYLWVFPSKELIVIRLIGWGRGKESDMGAYELAERATELVKDGM